MQFEISSSFISNLRDAIKAGNEALTLKLLEELYAPDIAEIFNELSTEESKFVYQLFEEQLAADVLVELEDDLREDLLSSFTSKEIAEQIDYMDSDDATDVISELPNQIQEEVLSQIEGRQASDIVDLLNYDEHSAGGIMATELIKVHLNSTSIDCVREIREQADDVDEIYSIYVVDDNERLVGILSLKKLVVSPNRSQVVDLYNPKVISVKTNTDEEEVANIMDKYDLVVIPVVDQIGRLVGRITIDDIVDVRREEETEDAQKMAGVEAFDEPYMNLSIFEVLKKRAGWLVILFLGETLTASAMGIFEDDIAKVVILALFVPLIISSGGNTGSQASTLVIRALALGEITLKNWWEIIQREIKVGLALGLVLGLIGFTRIALWAQFSDIYGPHYLKIALIVSSSLVGVVLWGNIVGSIFPLILKRLKFDPAVSSAPFVATLVDVTGLLIYFSVASALLSNIVM